VNLLESLALREALAAETSASDTFLNPPKILAPTFTISLTCEAEPPSLTPKRPESVKLEQKG